MDKYHEMFDEQLAKKFKRLPDGKWMHTEGVGETFICFGNNTPLQEFKARCPYTYKMMFDQWFDEVHPY